MLIVLAPSPGISPMFWILPLVSVCRYFSWFPAISFLANAAPSRVISCVSAYACFYSAIALLYIALFTSINVELALKNLLQKPVFYHLWFFFAIAVIYLVSPLIQVKNVGGKMLLVLMVVIGIIANPNTVPQKIDGFEWLPINLYINGDTFYYILYGMLGRAIGMMDTQHKALSWVSAALFATGFLLSLAGHYMNYSGAEILPIPGIFTVGRWFLSAQSRYWLWLKTRCIRVPFADLA